MFLIWLSKILIYIILNYFISCGWFMKGCKMSKRQTKQDGPSPKKQCKPVEKNKKDKSNDDLQFEELKKMVDDIRSAFKCGVCLAALQKDMATCVNGHCICTKCHRTIQPNTLCPTCRESFSNVKQNSLARQVLDIIPHICRHTVDCPYLVRSGDDHESYCHFRLTTCEFCKQEVQGVNLAKHVKDNHPGEEVFSEKSYVLTEYNVEQNTTVNCQMLFSTYNNFLWVLVSINPTTGLISYKFVPVFCGKPQHNLFVKISLTSDLAPHKPDYEVSTVVKMNTDINPSEGNYLIIPLSVAKKFYIQETKQLFYNINISKIKY